MAEDDPHAPRKLGNTEESLRAIQEKADDIEKAEILVDEAILRYGGYPVPMASGTMILHLMNECYFIPPVTTEAVLNDGILNRMKIKIVLTARPR